MKAYEVILRLLLAIIIGGAVGYEREFKNRPAGFRTHILVCVGAAVISMIQLYSVNDTINMITLHPEMAASLKADIGRLGAQVISGIGFLGAGTIIHEKGSVKGLTTAASLWVVACIGLGIGLGYYYLSILATICVALVLVSLKRFEDRFLDKNNVIKLEIEYKNKKDIVQVLSQYFNGRSIKIKNIEFGIEDPEDESKYMTSLYTIVVPKYIKEGEILSELMEKEEVIRVTVV